MVAGAIAHPHVLLGIFLLAVFLVVVLLFFFIIVPVGVMLIGAYVIYVGKGALASLLVGSLLLLGGLVFLAIVLTSGHLVL